MTRPGIEPRSARAIGEHPKPLGQCPGIIFKLGKGFFKELYK